MTWTHRLAAPQGVGTVPNTHASMYICAHAQYTLAARRKPAGRRIYMEALQDVRAPPRRCGRGARAKQRRAARSGGSPRTRTRPRRARRRARAGTRPQTPPPRTPSTASQSPCRPARSQASLSGAAGMHARQHKVRKQDYSGSAALHLRHAYTATTETLTLQPKHNRLGLQVTSYRLQVTPHAT